MAVINGNKTGDHTFFQGLNQVVVIAALDGESLFNPFHITGGDYPMSVEVTPGKHRVSFRYFHMNRYAFGNLWLVAEAGKSYTAQFQAASNYVSIILVDDATGKPVGGIQGSDDEPNKPLK